MVSLADYERVEAAANRMFLRPEVIWNPYLPEGICVSTTIGALTADPFTQTEGA